MPRPKGALNRRTRAALEEAQSGQFKGDARKTIAFLQKIVDDPSKPEDVRMRAADILLPYQSPKLAAIEQTIVEPKDKLDPKELEGSLTAMINEKPELLEAIITLSVRKAPELHARLVRHLQEIAPEVPASENVLALPRQ